MRRIAIAVALLLSAGEASAISRYDIDNRSCAAVQAIVDNDGAAILRWRSKRTGMTLYDRFVRNRSWCYGDQTTDYRSVPAADRSCPVKRCIEVDLFDNR